LNKRNLVVSLHLLLPTLCMMILAALAFPRTDDLFTHELALTSLVIYYPLLFILQGIACCWLRTNIFISLASSIVGYFLVMFFWLNFTASIYLLVYIIVWFVAYGVTRLIVRQ